MTQPFTPRIGGVLSADIAVPDHERVLRFYSRVLGTGETPLWRDDLTNSLGMPVIGVGARTKEHDDLPVQWMPHIQVADVAASARIAAEHGGRVLMSATDESGRSQWAVLSDPDGAAFGVIPVVDVEEVRVPENEASLGAAPTGCIAWLDLTVSDAASTRDFYRRTVGWSVQDVAMEDAGEHYADYNMMGGDGVAAAGVCHARGVNRGLPSTWTLYLPVGDLAESLRHVQDGSGTIITEVARADGAQAYVVVADPVGATFALVPG